MEVYRINVEELKNGNGEYSLKELKDVNAKDKNLLIDASYIIKAENGNEFHYGKAYDYTYVFSLYENKECVACSNGILFKEVQLEFKVWLENGCKSRYPY
jgi:hypothetical protein